MTSVGSLHKPEAQRPPWVAWAVVSIPFIAGCVWFVALYMGGVSLERNINEARAEAAALEVKNAELKEALVKLVSSEHLRERALARGFVEEKHPLYRETSHTWAAFVSE